MRQLGNATNRQRAKNYKQEDSKTSLTSQFQTAHRLAARAKTRAIFVKRTGLDCAIKYRPAEPPPSPRDQNFVFVTNHPTSEQTPPYPVAGQRADCRGRDLQFSSRIFLLGDDFPDPLHVAASFAHLEFSYRTIPLRRIRFACRLIAGAKFGRIFRQEMRKPVTPEASQAKKDGATLLTKIAPLFIGGSALPRL